MHLWPEQFLFRSLHSHFQSTKRWRGDERVWTWRERVGEGSPSKFSHSSTAYWLTLETEGRDVIPHPCQEKAQICWCKKTKFLH